VKTIIHIVLASIILLSCGRNDEKSDAYGNFEATEIMVSSQQNGVLVSFAVEEGMHLAKGTTVGVVDTMQIYLKRKQALAQKQLVLSKYTGIESGVDVQKQQKVNLSTELDRVKKLLAGGAATEKQLDDIEANLSLIEKQIRSTKTQFSMVQAELGTINANIESINDLLDRCKIINPISGTVTQKFVEQGEIVAMGKALYKIAPLDTLELKAYISGSQLDDIAIGDTVSVITDKNADENRMSSGRVSWISSQAEFTPKIIQTKEERVNLVYAIKIKVPNTSGVYKIGMPAEVMFSAK